jgi:hypothetical protein
MSRTIARTAPAAAICLFLGVAACGSDPDGSAQSKEDQPAAGVASVVYTMTLDSGNQVQFLQTPDSNMFVHERGTFPSKPTEVDLPAGHRSVRDIYAFLAPGQPMPPELAEAIARLEQSGLRPGAQASVPPDDIPEIMSPPPPSTKEPLSATWWSDNGTSPDGCPWVWFIQNLCWITGDPGDVCQANIGYAKATAGYHHDYTASCTASGSTQVTLKYSACSFFWCPTYTLFSDTQYKNQWWKDVLMDSTNTFWSLYSVVPSGQAHTARHHAF